MKDEIELLKAENERLKSIAKSFYRIIKDYFTELSGYDVTTGPLSVMIDYFDKFFAEEEPDKHIHFIKNDIGQKALRLYEQGERIGLVEDFGDGNYRLVPANSERHLRELIEKYKEGGHFTLALATLEDCGGQDFGFEIIK